MGGGERNNMPWLPHVSYGDIYNYCVLSMGVDGQKMKNCKNLESFKNCFGNNVGRVY